MSKQMPWDKWYPQDWLSDRKLSRCKAATRGIWADAVNTMLLERTDRISGTDEELSVDCRCTVAEFKAAFSELKRRDVCDAEVQNGCKTLICRRLKRAVNLSEIRRDAANTRWKPDANADANTVHDVNANGMQDANASSASAYASASSYDGESAERGATIQANPPTLEELHRLAVGLSIKPAWIDDYFHHYNSQGWVKKNGIPITNHRSAMTTWANNQRQRDREKPGQWEPKGRRI